MCVCVCVCVCVLFMIKYCMGNFAPCASFIPASPPLHYFVIYIWGGNNTQLYRIGSFPEIFPVMNSGNSAPYHIFSPKSLDTDV